MEEIFMGGSFNLVRHSSTPISRSSLELSRRTLCQKIKMKCQKGAVNGCCIVVEYVGGGTLRSYLSKHTMKTESLLFSKSGEVKMIDFGICNGFFSLGMDYLPMMGNNWHYGLHGS